MGRSPGAIGGASARDGSCAGGRSNAPSGLWRRRTFERSPSGEMRKLAGGCMVTEMEGRVIRTPLGM